MAPGPALNASLAFPSVHAVRLHWRGGQVRCVSLLPAVVHADVPAVNDAQVHSVSKEQRQHRLAAFVALVASSLHAVKRLLRAGLGWLPVHTQGPDVPRWPAVWPYADGAPGWRNTRFLPDQGADRFAFAPDVIVDQSGRILRL